jgi:lipoprotein-anchoring transpeptidase ErfK/SrfK
VINRWLVGALIVVTPFSTTAHASSGDQQATTTTTTTTIALPTTTTVPEAVSLPVPKQSGVGRRVVYANQGQRVWVINDDNEVIRTFLVSGMKGQPKRGSYTVFSQSASSYSPELAGVTFRFMTRFAIGRNGGNIGFHEIPLRNGKPMQTVEQLGTFLGSGCLRSSTEDALFIYRWAKPGTRVVVVP